jgi:hypothetical protein
MRLDAKELLGISAPCRESLAVFSTQWNAKWNSVDVSAEELAELLRKAANLKLAERVGVVKIVLRPSSNFYRRLPTLSASASEPETRFAAGFVRLPLVSDFAGAMELEMALDREILQRCPRRIHRNRLSCAQPASGRA